MPDLPGSIPVPLPDPAARPLAGVGWMVVTGLFFVGVTAAVKHGARDLPAAEAAFLRYFLGLVFLIPMIGPMRRTHLTRRQLKLFGFRGAAHSIGVILWFFAMTRITIAEVTAMNYLSPVYITIGAALFLGETFAIRRMIAIAVAFIGALIILRPGFRELDNGHLAMLSTAVLFAFSYLTAKRMSAEVHPAVVVCMLSLVVMVGLFPFAVAVWQWPTGAEISWMFLVAFLATAGHYTMTLAFAAAPVSTTQPVTFLQLIWSVILGTLVFSEPTDIWVIIGGTLILGATTFIAIREAIPARRSSRR